MAKNWKILKFYFFAFNHNNYVLCYRSRLILGMFVTKAFFLLLGWLTAEKPIVKVDHSRNQQLSPHRNYKESVDLDVAL